MAAEKLQQNQQPQAKPAQQLSNNNTNKAKEAVEVPLVAFFAEELKDVPTISQLFPDGHFPPGEICEYTQPANLWRSTSAEKKEVCTFFYFFYFLFFLFLFLFFYFLLLLS
jgi:hypothetical protein